MLYLGEVIQTVRVMMNTHMDIYRTANSIRWTDSELARFVEDGVQEYVFLNPEGWATEDGHICTKSPQQLLSPDYYIKILAVDLEPLGWPQWLGGIKRVERNVIDSFYAAWPSAAAAPVDPAAWVPQMYALDPQNPLAFWVYPCPAAGSTLRTYAVLRPDNINLATDNLLNVDLDQPLTYLPYSSRSALADYVMHRICLLEGDGAANDDAAFYYDQFRRRATRQWETATKEMTEGARVPPEAE